jgi:tRNA (adenine37-N6)-methyltransferase
MAARQYQVPGHQPPAGSALHSAEASADPSAKRTGGKCLSMGTSEAWREPVTLQPIGVVRDGRTTADDDYWGGFISTIELDADRFGPDALAALDTFSHVIVIFHFHLLEEAAVERGGRHPRGREDWPVVGIFAQRAKRRPNRIGVSTCGLVSVNDTRLTVEGLDAMAGTPVLDLKPYMVEFEPRGEISQPAWSHELMETYFAEIPQAQ